MGLRRLLSIAVVTVAALGLLPAPAGGDTVADEAGFVQRINALRASKGLAALRLDSRLTSVARSWSAQMAQAGTISHNPNLSQQAPPEWERLGENVGVGPTVDTLHTAFVNSPAHYANLVNSAYNHVGVGVVASGGRLWVTEVFMTAPITTVTIPVITAGTHWYRVATAGGQVYGFGVAAALPAAPVSAPVVGMASTPTGNGAWLVSSDGGVYALGDAGFYGSARGLQLNAPIVGIAALPNGRGYWLLGRDGGVFSYGEARFFGSTGSLRLNQPVVGMAAHPSGNGYWFVAADGGIFAYGAAGFYGSTGSLRLNQPVVGMAATRTGNGYWLVARDGGIFAFGAPFYGSTGTIRLNQPIVGMTPAPSGAGYRFVAADGGIFAFGDAPFLGSTGSQRLPAPVVAMSSGA